MYTFIEKRRLQNIEQYVFYVFISYIKWVASIFGWEISRNFRNEISSIDFAVWKIEYKIYNNFNMNDFSKSWVFTWVWGLTSGFPSYFEKKLSLKLAFQKKTKSRVKTGKNPLFTPIKHLFSGQDPPYATQRFTAHPTVPLLAHENTPLMNCSNYVSFFLQKKT